MDQFSQSYSNLQISMANQISDLKGQAQNDYINKIGDIQRQFNLEKLKAGSAYDKAVELKNIAKEKAETIQKSLSEVGSSIEASTLGRHLLAKGIKNIKSKLKSGKDTVDNLKSKIQDKLEAAEDRVSNLKNTAESKLSDAQNRVSDLQSNIESKTADLKGQVNEFKSNVESKYGDIQDQIESKVSDIQDTAEGMRTNLSDEASNIQSTVESKLSEVGDIQVKPPFARGAEIEMQDFSLPADDVLGGPAYKFGIDSSAIPDSVNPAQVSSLNFEEEAETGSKVGRMLGKGLRGIKSGINKIGGGIRNVLQKAQQAKAQVQNVGEEAVSTAKNTASEALSTAEESKGTLVKGLQAAKSSITEAADSTSKAATDALNEGISTTAKATEGAADVAGDVAGDVAEGVGEAVAEGAAEAGGEVAAELGIGALFGPIGEGVALVAGLATTAVSVGMSVADAVKKTSEIVNPAQQIQKKENSAINNVQKHIDMNI